MNSRLAKKIRKMAGGDGKRYQRLKKKYKEDRANGTIWKLLRSAQDRERSMRWKKNAPLESHS